MEYIIILYNYRVLTLLYKQKCIQMMIMAEVSINAN